MTLGITLIVAMMIVAAVAWYSWRYADKTIGDAATIKPFESTIEEECEEAAMQHSQAFNDIPEVLNDDDLIRRTRNAVKYGGDRVSVPLQSGLSPHDGHEVRSGEILIFDRDEGSLPRPDSQPKVDKSDPSSGDKLVGDAAVAHDATHKEQASV
jgi:hypothetical protein